jgi:soluble lytic murein transglycosylase-like protein
LRLLLVVPLLLVAGAGDRPAAEGPAAPGPVLPVPLDLSAFVLDLDPAMMALEARDFRGLLRALHPLTSQESPMGRHGRLVLGLYAHAMERPREAAELLAEWDVEAGPLEDWRLWLLADVRAAAGDGEGAREALEQLVSGWPGSPLHLRALARAAELAWEHRDHQRALESVALGRARDAGGEHGQRLEKLAWAIAEELGDQRLMRSTARRLLTEFPFTAAELEVAELFRGADGKLQWSSILLPAEQVRRAHVLLELQLAPSALITLDAVPEGARSLEWYLLRARALIAQNRGGDALTLLARAPSQGPEEWAQVEWVRALAALDRSRARRGGEKLPAAERDRFRRQGIESLQQVVVLDTDRELVARALRRLFEEHAQDERIGSAIATLKQLRALDPRDTTGSRFLWERGWKQYRSRNYTGAIGYWSELADLSPSDRFARGARYWSARAYQELGDRQRAREIYREVVGADTTDFYRRHALARLGAEPPLVAGDPPEPWPSDPVLERARFFTDIGLHGLALAELELVEQLARPRAAAALRGLALFRSGQVRASMTHLRNAFPALATPHQASVPSEALRLYYPLLYEQQIRYWAGRRGLPLPLVLGVIRQESAFDLNATSSAGARGLMQVMPATARELAGKLGLPYSEAHLYDPDYSVQLGTSYLRQMLDMFDGEVDLALAGYNAGPYRIRRLWREASAREVDTFIEGLQLEEPRTYVKRIVLLADSYERLYRDAG